MRKILNGLLMGLLVVMPVVGQEPAKHRVYPEDVGVQMVVPTGDIAPGDPVTFTFTVLDREFQIDRFGALSQIEPASEVELPNLSSEGWFIDDAYCIPWKEYFIFVSELSIMIEGRIVVDCVDLNEGKRLWRLKSRGFNLGKPLLYIDALYFGSSGSVRKIDLTTGDCVWKQENLYEESPRLNSVCETYLEGEWLVVVPDYGCKTEAEPLKLWFDKESGEYHISVDTPGGE